MPTVDRSDTTRTMTVGGRPITVRDAGPRVKEAVLVVNGSAANMLVLDRFITVLSRTRRVIAFDQPGMGRSAATYPTLLVPDLSLLCARLVRDLGVESVTVVGYSFGGAVAEHLALTRPDLVERLVLISAVYGAAGVPTDPLSGLAVFAHQTSLQPVTRQAARRAYGGGIARSDAALQAYEHAIGSQPPDPLSFLGQAIAVSTWTALPWLWAIRCPTLVLSGSQDHVVLATNARILAALIPKARLAILPGAGHLLVMDEADEVAERVESFLSGGAGTARPRRRSRSRQGSSNAPTVAAQTPAVPTIAAVGGPRAGKAAQSNGAATRRGADRSSRAVGDASTRLTRLRGRPAEGARTAKVTRLREQ